MTSRRYTFAALALAAAIAAIAMFVSSDNESPQSVSLIELIANPERFDGKKVITEGYFVYGLENQALYLSELDQKNFSAMNKILWSPVDARVPRSLFLDSHCRYVMIWGTFVARSTGDTAIQRFFGDTRSERSELQHIENILAKSEASGSCERDPMK